jgi:2-hydroxycyclohexanecarboxyl-CoA dehydrogenase
MTERIAMITGAGSGIGQAVSVALAGNTSLVITDISSPGLEATAGLIAATGNECRSLIMDVTDRDSVQSATREISDATGHIDILVNCAGWDSLMPFIETDEAFWDRIIDLNYKGVLRTTHAVLPGMISRGWGRIVNISSDAGRVGSSMEAVYSGAKGGIIAFSKTIAREVARDGITVNTVCPGPTETAMLDEIIDAGDDGERVINAMTRGVPMKRLGKPEDIASAVKFLASEEASYITGQTLSVSGGLTMA